MNYITFFGSNDTFGLTDIYKIMTKKYFRGRKNHVVHHKIMKKITFRNEYPDKMHWSKILTNAPQKHKISMVLQYSNLYWPDKGHVSCEITTECIKLHTFDIIDMKLLTSEECIVKISDLRQYGELTEETYFMISTAHNLYGLSYQDCKKLLRVVDVLVDA